MRTQCLYGIVGITILCLVTSRLGARTWCVNADGTGDAPTIEAGLDSSIAGDTVLVACGTYYEHGIYMKSGVCLRGETTFPPCVTIDGQHNNYIMLCASNNASTLVEGITFTHAHYDAINCSASFLTVQHCIISDTDFGGALAICCGSNPIFYNCLIYRNFDANHTGKAITVSFGAQPTFSHCTIAKNSGGFVLSDDGGVTIEHSIIAYLRDVDVFNYDWLTLPGPVLISCSDFYGNHGAQDSVIAANGIGCFSADPQFCGILGSHNYYLQSDSPCAPGNHPDGYECGLIGALPINCEKVGVEKKSWGAIKSLYKKDG